MGGGSQAEATAYPGGVKEFWVYTGMRLLLFVASLGLVVAVWRLVGGAPGGGAVLWVVVIAFVLSGVGSYVLLNRQREALAQRVQRRAEQATARFEQMRSKEDVDD